MKLVDYLRSLFKATSARPQEKPQKMELAEGNGNFPVSQDCWVSLQCSDPKPSPYSCYLWGESHLNHATASSSSMQQAGWTVQALGFYRKGQRVFYSANGFKNVSALIFPIVGGVISFICSEVSYAC